MPTNLTVDVNYLMAEALGPENGIRREEVESILPALKEAHDGFGRLHRSRKTNAINLPDRGPDIDAIIECATGFKENTEDVVVLGIGGSALGPRAIDRFLRGGPALERKPRAWFLDNVCADSIGAVLDRLEPASSVVVVISKSGSTIETAAQFLIFRDWGRRSGSRSWRERFLLVTDPEQGPLREIARREKLRTFEIPREVGGRYSVLSPVGLLPAALIGADIDALLRGAASMNRRGAEKDVWGNPPLLWAALTVLHDSRRHRPISVLWAYGDRLIDCAEWYQQIWAESLGKRHDLSGQVVQRGSTPVRALGATDQHSQLQLYIEGPADKTITFLALGAPGRDLDIPAEHALSDLAPFNTLPGCGLNALLEAERMATELALFEAGRPSATVSLPAVTPTVLGAFFQFFEIATVCAGALYRVNPFDQPGVQRGKTIAQAILTGRAGEEMIDASQRKRAEKRSGYVL